MMAMVQAGLMLQFKSAFDITFTTKTYFIDLSQNNIQINLIAVGF